MCECRTTCQVCGRPRAVCVESGWCALGAPDVPTGQLTDDGHVIFEPYRRADTVAGMTVHNPAGDEPWTLDVLAVHPAPGEPGAVILHAVQGDVLVARDWPTAPRTAEDDQIEADLLLAVAFRDTTTAPPHA